MHWGNSIRTLRSERSATLHHSVSPVTSVAAVSESEPCDLWSECDPDPGPWPRGDRGTPSSVS